MSIVANEVLMALSIIILMLFAGVFGLWLSVAAIFLIALLDNTFKSEEDIEKQLGLVTIGIIPTTESCRKKG